MKKILTRKKKINWGKNWNAEIKKIFIYDHENNFNFPEVKDNGWSKIQN